MNIEKCDLCLRQINDDDKEITVRLRPSYDSFSLCESCGQPVLRFLYKNKLVKQGAKSAFEELREKFGTKKKQKTIKKLSLKSK